MRAWPNHEYSVVPSRTRALTLAREVRRACLGESATASGWCDLRAVCSAARVSVKQKPFTRDGDGTDAILVPRAGGGFVVLVDPVPAGSRQPFWMTVRHRNRFRIAHELGHTFFYSRSGALQPVRKLDPSPDEETFCDAFASALLVPPGTAGAYSATPESVYRISDGFEVSAQAAARAVAREHPGVSVLGLLWSPNPRTGEYGPRVVWNAGEHFVPRGARLQSEAAHEIFSGATHVVRQETLELRELAGPYEVEALRLPDRRQAIVVARPRMGTPARVEHLDTQLSFWA